MKTIESKTVETQKDDTEVVSDVLSKNTDLYNKYTMLLASIFISALTAIGQHENRYNIWLKISIFLFSISLLASLIEISLLIIRDAIFLNAIPFNTFRKLPLMSYKKAAWFLAFLSLIGFILGTISINIFIAKL